MEGTRASAGEAPRICASLLTPPRFNGSSLGRRRPLRIPRLARFRHRRLRAAGRRAGSDCGRPPILQEGGGGRLVAGG